MIDRAGVYLINLMVMVFLETFIIQFLVLSHSYDIEHERLEQHWQARIEIADTD